MVECVISVIHVLLFLFCFVYLVFISMKMQFSLSLNKKESGKTLDIGIDILQFRPSAENSWFLSRFSFCYLEIKVSQSGRSPKSSFLYYSFIIPLIS